MFCISVNADMKYRKIVNHMECLSDVFPFAYKSVRIYGTFCLASVKRFSIDGKRIVCKHALLGDVPSGIPLRCNAVGVSIPVAGLLVGI